MRKTLEGGLVRRSSAAGVKSQRGELLKEEMISRVVKQKQRGLSLERVELLPCGPGSKHCH